jgi:LysR family transcriptional regulator, transcriptional activator of the cysJI operon
MLQNINLDYYKVFYQVAKEQNITSAAKTLLISQPAVTQTIAKLEEQLDVKLLVRQSRGITLTKIGKIVFEEVSKGLIYFNNIKNIIEDERDLLIGEIEIGCSTSLARVLLTEPIAKFNKDYPNIKIKIIDQMTNELLYKLSLSQTDLVIGQLQNYKYENLEYKKLLDENYIFICNKNYDTGNIKMLEDLKKHPLILGGKNTSSRNIFDELVKNKLAVVSSIEVTGYNMVLELVKNNVGIGFLPEYFVAGFIKDGVLQKINLDLNLNAIEYAYFVNKNTKTKAVREFLKYLK